LLLSDGQYTILPVTPGAFYTAAAGINSAGQIVGSYRDAGAIIHGYLLSDGGCRTLDPPGSTMTEAWWINDLGQIVGQYSSGGTIHGFLLRQGNYTTVDVPGATSAALMGSTTWAKYRVAIRMCAEATASSPPLRITQAAARLFSAIGALDRIGLDGCTRDACQGKMVP
jgi:hypothetical protein